MAYTVKKLLEIAAAEIGYHEKNSPQNLDQKTASNDGAGNFTKYARDLAAAGYYQASKQGFEWCDVFVDWCFWRLCGGNKAAAEAMECQTGVYGAGVDWSARYYRDHGRYDNTPKAGDQVFFGNYSHTGIVEKVDDGYVYTIEGNSSNQVRRRKYSIYDNYLKGFGHPLYEKEPEPVPEPEDEMTEFENQFEEMRKDLQDNDSSSWSNKAKKWAIENGIIAGIGNGPDGKPNYAWEDFVTREQLVQILYNFTHR